MFHGQSCVLPTSLVLWVAAAAAPQSYNGVPYVNVLHIRTGPCDPQSEYWHEGRCCLNCPAGTHVKEHCLEDHQRGRCTSCTYGEDYTQYPNGIVHCLPCDSCGGDKELVKLCTLTSNTICQCKRGTYCPRGACEICSTCTRCGGRVKLECNATSDTVCEDDSGYPKTTETADTTREIHSETVDNALYITVGCVVGAAVLIFICRYAFLKIKGHRQRAAESGMSERAATTMSDAVNTAAPPERNPYGKRFKMAEDNDCPLAEAAPSTSCERESLLQASRADPSASPVLASCMQSQGPNQQECCPQGQASSSESGGRRKLTEEEWTRCFQCFTRNVPVNKWTEFMRTLHPSETIIETCTYKHPFDPMEQNYQMLRQWRQEVAQKASVMALLDSLVKVHLNSCRENVINALRDENIPIS